jgi:hypothetical protein
MPSRSILQSRFSHLLHSALLLVLLLAPAISSAKTYVLPHVLESKGMRHSSFDGAVFGFSPVELASLSLTTNQDSAVCIPCNLGTGDSASASYTFDTSLFYTYTASPGSPPEQLSFFDVFSEIDYTRTSVLSDELQVFDTEMLSLSIGGGGGGGGGSGGFLLRESPTKRSTGQTTIRALPGGGYDVDSFFDVFTELSLDGGQTWAPSDASMHLVLTQVPEPSTALLTGLGMLGLGVYRRRQSQS